MTGVVVTTSGTKIHVDFNDFTLITETRKACFPDTGILAVMIKHFDEDGEYVEVHVESPDNRWRVSTDGYGQSLIIDSINGIIPTDIDHLKELLCSIMA